MESVKENNHVEEPIAPVLGEGTPHGLENGVFGKWTIRLRNVCGFAACFTVCLCSILYVYSTYLSVSAGHGWPDRTSLLIITCGPIIIAFTFMDSSKILRILSQTSGIGEALRRRTAQALYRPGDIKQAEDENQPK